MNGIIPLLSLIGFSFTASAQPTFICKSASASYTMNLSISKDLRSARLMNIDQSGNSVTQGTLSCQRSPQTDAVVCKGLVTGQVWGMPQAFQTEVVMQTSMISNKGGAIIVSTPKSKWISLDYACTSQSSISTPF